MSVANTFAVEDKVAARRGAKHEALLGFGTTAESKLHRDKRLRGFIAAQRSSRFAAAATILFFFTVSHDSIVFAYQPFDECLAIRARYACDEVCVAIHAAQDLKSRVESREANREVMWEEGVK